jgi:hypothetical protein
MGRPQAASSDSGLPPGTAGRLLVDNALDLSRDCMGFLLKCARENGDAIFFRFFNVAICLLAHPAFIEQVLVTNQTNFLKSRDFRVLAYVMCEGLLSLEGDKWR